MIKNFRTLDLAFRFNEDIERMLKELSPVKRDQLERAVLSVVNNLMEGSAKASIKDRKRLYTYAFGSFRECQGMLYLFKRKDLLEKHDMLGACLYKLSRS